MVRVPPGTSQNARRHLARPRLASVSARFTAASWTKRRSKVIGVLTPRLPPVQTVMWRVPIGLRRLPGSTWNSVLPRTTGRRPLNSATVRYTPPRTGPAGRPGGLPSSPGARGPPARSRPGRAGSGTGSRGSRTRRPAREQGNPVPAARAVGRAPRAPRRARSAHGGTAPVRPGAAPRAARPGSEIMAAVPNASGHRAAEVVPSQGR